MYKLKHQILEKFLLKFPRLSNILLRYSFNNKLGKFFKSFQLNNNIDYVYDIGAFKGEWSEFYKKTSLSKSKFILFEANESHSKILYKKNFKFFCAILSDKEKKVDFFNNEDSTGDSYYKENTFQHKYLKPKTLSTTTLDYLVQKNNLPKPHLIKIDTQGSEIDILKGARETIEDCKLIYLECPIAKLNNNDLDINHYLKYLNSINFIPQEICDIHHYHGYLVQVDMLFMRKDLYIKGNNFDNELLKNFF